MVCCLLLSAAGGNTHGQIELLRLNMMRAERTGYAVMLDWQTLNTKDLVAAIQKAATDQDMRESVERSHRDQEETEVVRCIDY